VFGLRFGREIFYRFSNHFNISNYGILDDALSVEGFFSIAGIFVNTLDSVQDMP